MPVIHVELGGWKLLPWVDTVIAQHIHESAGQFSLRDRIKFGLGSLEYGHQIGIERVGTVVHDESVTGVKQL